MGPAGGVGLLFGFSPIVYCVREGDEINTKSRGGGWRLRLCGDVGADCRKTGSPPCRLHHSHRHAWHDAIRRDGTKSGLWPFKKSGFRRCKNSCLSEPPPQQPESLPKPSLMGWSYFLLSLRRLCGSHSNWGRLGWGLLVGWGFSLAFPPLFIASVRVMK